MSKCDIVIEFDQADRTYRGGETVSGMVRVQVNKDLTSQGITLTRYWKTHGRGNTDAGTKHEQTLAGEGELRAGETFEFPFSFESECQPLTYHGHHINVDHYVRVNVDVPWAFDPKAEEEYILRPGRRPEEISAGGGKMVRARGQLQTRISRWLTSVFVIVVAGVLGVVFHWKPLEIFLLGVLPMLVLLGLVRSFWKKLVSSRVGEVQIVVSRDITAPGEPWSCQLRFTPRKRMEINGITAKLEARESAVSSSGTKTRRYRNTVFEKLYTIRPAGTLAVGMQVDEQFSITFPDTEIYTLSKLSNNVFWSVQFRIDIARSPDWTQDQSLHVVPAEFLKELDDSQVSTVANPRPAATLTAPEDSSRTGLDTTENLVDRAEPTADVPETAGPPAGDPVVQSETTPLVSPLLALVEELSQVRSFGDEHAQIIQRSQGQVLELTIEVDRVTSTYRSSIPDSHGRGKTITGTIAGSEQSVQLLTRNDSGVGDLARGERWRGFAVVSDWDTLYKRLRMLESPRS